MNSLNIDNINFHSPYIVGFDGKAFLFTTDSGIAYRVDFEQDSNPYFTAYWFNLANPQHQKSPGDVKIAQTVICIIEEFFRVNPEVQQKRYAIKSYDVRSTDAEGKPTKEYVALIIQRTNPRLDEIIARFDSEIAMFNDFKP